MLPAVKTQAVTAEDSTTIAALIDHLPNGVQAWETKFEGLPQTSLNLGIMELKEELELLIYPRSSINTERQALQDKLKQIMEAHGAVYGQYGVFSALFPTSCRVWSAFLPAPRPTLSIPPGNGWRSPPWAASGITYWHF